MNDPCNPSSDLSNLRLRLKTNFLLPKSYSANYNHQNICNVFKYCKNATSLPPMKFVTTDGELYLIDRFSPLSAHDYKIVFGSGKKQDVARVAKKLGIIDTNMPKLSMRGSIVKMLRKMGINEPIKVPITMKAQAKKGAINSVNGKNIFGTPPKLTNNNNKIKNIFGTPPKNNNNNNNNNNKIKSIFGTPPKNNNNNKNNKPGLFGSNKNKNKNKNNKPGLFGSLKAPTIGAAPVAAPVMPMAAAPGAAPMAPTGGPFPAAAPMAPRPAGPAGGPGMPRPGAPNIQFNRRTVNNPLTQLNERSQQARANLGNKRNITNV